MKEASMSGTLIFVTGGSKSGKSFFAENIVNEAGEKIAYFATGVPVDKEMEDRIAKHRQRRSEKWLTFEGFSGLGDTVRARGGEFDGLIVDCLSALVSNIILSREHADWDVIAPEMAEELESDVEAEVLSLLDALSGFTGTAVIVSNEVGMGVVPPSALGRLFRDLAGSMNQRVASRADRAYLLVAGIPLTIK
jgi:adenosylcobinamide kinase / adenosylcobinamide-phosphate guanylyltransferase